MQFPLYIIDGIYPSCRFTSKTKSQEELYELVLSERKEELVVLKYVYSSGYDRAIYTTCPAFGFMPDCNTHNLRYSVDSINARLHFYTQEEFDKFLVLHAL